VALQIEEPDGATPLSQEDTEGLRVALRTRGELNEVEAMNIARAMHWLRRARPGDVLTEAFIYRLHSKMFGEVWKWAGAQRVRETTVGVPPHLIPMRLRDTLQDVRYWLEHRTFPLDEIGIRYHHRLVAVHPFPNGNGRHARLAADDLMFRNGAAPLRWGGGDLLNRGDVRTRYMAALRDADRGDYRALIEACR
jgi:Fic-DOC domain mobile mystery protein B